MATATINANAKKLERKASIKARIEELRRESCEGRESSAAATPGGATEALEGQQIQAKAGAPQAGAHPGSAAETAKERGISPQYRARARARRESPAPAAPPAEQAEGAPQPRGRPSIYTDELAAELLARLAAGEPLRSICRSETMPDEKTVRAWARDPDHPIAERYAQAREMGFFSIADEILEIADDSRNDFIDRITRSGDVERVIDEEAIARSRMRIAARQWLLSKALPQTFGEKVEQNLRVTDLTPRPTMDRAEWDETASQFFAAARDYRARAAAEAAALSAPDEAKPKGNGRDR
jgi:hypothetical protein